MSEKTKKPKKNKQKNEEKPSGNTNIEKTKDKPTKKRKTKDDSNEVIEKRSVKFTEETVDNEVEGDPSSKKKRKPQLEPEELAPLSEELEAEINRPENIKNVASKRQQKRDKYEKLKTDNKLKSEAQMQQKALNYLSLWKHNRQEWKFEKIKQIWLQTHMYDSARVPDEFWDTTIQYFGGSKGRIRQVLIDQCMKIMDEADKSDDEEKETSEIEETKLKRARELLQHLQE